MTNSKSKFTATILTIIALFAVLMLVIACTKPVKSVGVA